MNKLRKIFILLFGIMASVQVMAQDKIVHPQKDNAWLYNSPKSPP